MQIRLVSRFSIQHSKVEINYQPHLVAGKMTGPIQRTEHKTVGLTVDGSEIPRPTTSDGVKTLKIMGKTLPLPQRVGGSQKSPSTQLDLPMKAADSLGFLKLMNPVELVILTFFLLHFLLDLCVDSRVPRKIEPKNMSL